MVFEGAKPPWISLGTHGGPDKIAARREHPPAAAGGVAGNAAAVDASADDGSLYSGLSRASSIGLVRYLAACAFGCASGIYASFVVVSAIFSDACLRGRDMRAPWAGPPPAMEG